MKTELLKLLEESDEDIQILVTGKDLIEFAKAYNQIEDRLLKRKEAAQMLGITEPTLYTWTRKGVIQQVKTGGMVRYKLSEVNRIKKGN